MSPINSIQISSDGSHTLMSEAFNVSYHSIHGAITESNHVFLDAGLDYKVNNGSSHISIFELGFGTGLNAFLSYLYAEKKEIYINYHAIELFPLSKDVFDHLNYGEILGHPNEFTQLHVSEWNKKIAFSTFFNLEKNFLDIVTYHTDQQYDIIYFDAFDPNAQPELWDVIMLQKMYGCLNDEGVLVTYCAQGEFKRNLKKVGFILDPLPGPPGKREMTRAIKRQLD